MPSKHFSCPTRRYRATALFAWLCDVMNDPNWPFRHLDYVFSKLIDGRFSSRAYIENPLRCFISIPHTLIGQQKVQGLDIGSRGILDKHKVSRLISIPVYS